ncbi:MAG: beta-ketoacyl-ACP synthase III [Chloroflexota bacterium]|nr:beta-ketoacyl-ACP synthase III [Chloroflexota bacterium]
MSICAHITGWGMSVPEHVLTNDDLSKMVDTDNEWIITRTGIRERRIAGDEQSTATLATEAALRALEVAEVIPGDLDLIIVSTSSPEHLFPSTASLVQDNIGAVKAGAFDLSAACTGFIFAVNMAAQAIRTGSIDAALVIGAETLSRLVDWDDRNTCVLFGDGAGAFVLQASDEPGGVLSAVMRSDGSGRDLLSLPAGASKFPASHQTVQDGLHYMHMKGRDVFRFATRVMAQATQEVVKLSGMSLDEIDFVIPHQANQRIIETAARRLKLPMERFVINLDRYGNTSTASIPMATVEAVQEGKIKLGDHVVLVGFGAGLTWGALVTQLTGPLPAEKSKGWRLRSVYQAYARIRSSVLRLLRLVEGFIWGRRR